MRHMLMQILRTGIVNEAAPAAADDWQQERARIDAHILATLGRALCIRQVDAGSCNACELEIHALGNPYYNLEGLGIKFVASPRHADLLLVTGPVTRNMADALLLTYQAMPDPKLVVAAGACACNGGVFGQNYACGGALAQFLPVNVNIPGCPPDPIALLRGILAAVTGSTTAAPPAES